MTHRHEPQHHGAEPPVEPGYPEHPEVHPDGHGQAAGHHTHQTHGGGHDKHAGHSVALFRDKFWISLALTLPTLIWGHMLPRAVHYAPPALPGDRWIAPVFGTAVFLYGGLVFLQGAWRELRDRLPGMMTLIALAITVAFGFSAAVTLGYPGMPLWEELATLVTIMLLGHWIEMRSISQAQGALQELAKLLPDTALRLQGAEVEEVPVGSLRVGDVLLIRPGAGVAADGVVVEGSSELNESMITGESRPVKKGTTR
jgi:Cu2+-exporting ATPase